MDRVETQRRIDSALSIFVVALVLGAFGGSFAWAGQAATWWLYQRGWTSNEVSGFRLLWSWCDALAPVATLGLMIGLWRLSRSFVGGRVRALASGALWAFAGTQVLSLLWRLISPWIMRRGAGAIQSYFTGSNVLHAVLELVGSGLWLAALVGLTRMTADGARKAWLGRLVLAGLGVVLVLGYSMFGQPRMLQWPGLAALAGVLVSVLSAAGLLAFVLPVRRVWRAHRDEPAVAIDGIYRRSEASPETPWREAPELRIAGAGLAEVHRRVVGLIVVTLAAIPVMFAVVSVRSLAAILIALIVLGAAQLAIAVRMTLGVASYTRAPAELAGRALGIAALLCHAAALVAWTKSLIGMGVTLVARDDSMVPANANLGASAAAFLGTVLLIASLGRAARGLGDAETRRRAGVALAMYLVTLGLLVIVGIYVGLHRGITLELLGWLVPGVAFVVGVVCMAIYTWLLSAAVGMQGWLAAEAPVPPAR